MVCTPWAYTQSRSVHHWCPINNPGERDIPTWTYFCLFDGVFERRITYTWKSCHFIKLLLSKTVWFVIELACILHRIQWYTSYIRPSLTGSPALNRMVGWCHNLTFCDLLWVLLRICTHYLFLTPFTDYSFLLGYTPPLIFRLLLVLKIR